MKPIGIIALSAAGLLIFSKTATASAASRLNIILGNVQLSSGGITVSLVAQNPTDISYTIRSIVGSLFVNGNYIANLSSFKSTVIPSNNEVIVPVFVRVTVLDILTNIDDLLKGISSRQVSFLLKGDINVDGIVVPLELTYKVL